MCLDYAIMPNHVAVFGLSQCDGSQAWFHKRSYTVTIGASSAGAIACGHLDFPTFQRTRVSPQAEKRWKRSAFVGKHLCPWYHHLLAIPLPKPFHNSPKPHRPKTQSDFGSKAKQFSHAGGLTIISPCEAMQIHSDKSWKGTWHVWKAKYYHMFIPRSYIGCHMYTFLIVSPRPKIDFMFANSMTPFKASCTAHHEDGTAAPSFAVNLLAVPLATATRCFDLGESGMWRSCLAYSVPNRASQSAWHHRVNQLRKNLNIYQPSSIITSLAKCPSASLKALAVSFPLNMMWYDMSRVYKFIDPKYQVKVIPVYPFPSSAKGAILEVPGHPVHNRSSQTCTCFTVSQPRTWQAGNDATNSVMKSLLRLQV